MACTSLLPTLRYREVLQSMPLMGQSRRRRLRPIFNRCSLCPSSVRIAAPRWTVAMGGRFGVAEAERVEEEGELGVGLGGVEHHMGELGRARAVLAADVEAVDIGGDEDRLAFGRAQRKAEAAAFIARQRAAGAAGRQSCFPLGPGVPLACRLLRDRRA